MGPKKNRFIIILLLLSLLPVACSSATADPADHEHEEGEAHEVVPMQILELPELEAVALDGEPLQVVATTSIIGDIVSQVGGDAIALTTLMEPGQDPHSYEPSARDLTAVADADLIFINGWNLEEGLIDDLVTINEEGVIVPISAGLLPLPFTTPHTHEEEAHEDDDHDEEAEEDHNHAPEGVDPHVWLDPGSVKRWVSNTAAVLSSLDPENTAVYEANAAAYTAQLEELIAAYETEVEAVPADQRKLVTNHGTLGYFADVYDFEIIGTVLPAMSTVAEPSARDLAALAQVMDEAGVCTIFTDTTVSGDLATAVAQEVEQCETIRILSLHTGSLGAPGSDAETYLEMMRANLDTILQGTAAQ